MRIPSQAEYILKKLAAAGFEGYLVGGCVRDFLLGKEPSDFDITTSALPLETAAVFDSDRVIPTGIKHGTVTVLHGGYSFEITTYRTETTYSDGRHPDSVNFSRRLSDDLCRRDFTVNAMAMGLDGKIVDLYGGREDLEKGIIRAVGEPNLRFTEDALRILRAFRFASKLAFDIEEKTLCAAAELSGRLSLVSRERIFAELEKLLCGKAAGKTLEIMSGLEIFGSIFDKPLINSKSFDLIDSLPLRTDIRLAALLICDERADEHTHSLKTSQSFFESVKGIIDCRLPDVCDAPVLRRAICKYGKAALLDRALIECNNNIFDAVTRILADEKCFGIADLKISGADIIENTNLRGRKVGEKLTEVLFAVFDEKIPNTYDAEIALIKS